MKRRTEDRVPGLIARSVLPAAFASTAHLVVAQTPAQAEGVPKWPPQQAQAFSCVWGFDWSGLTIESIGSLKSHEAEMAAPAHREICKT